MRIKVGDLVSYYFGHEKLMGIVLEIIPVDSRSAISLLPKSFSIKLLESGGYTVNTWDMRSSDNIDIHSSIEQFL